MKSQKPAKTSGFHPRSDAVGLRWCFRIWIVTVLLPNPEADTEASLFIPKILFLNSDILKMQVSRIQGAWCITKCWHISWVFRSSSRTICCIIPAFFLMVCFCIFIYTLWKESLDQPCAEEGWALVAAAAVFSSDELLERSPIFTCLVSSVRHPLTTFSPWPTVPIPRPHESQLPSHCHRCCRMTVI